MIPAATLKVMVQVKGIPEGNAQLRSFQGKLEEISHEKATATLAADVNSRGFDEFAAKIDETRLKTKRPIEQKVGIQYDKSTFSRALQDIQKLKQVWSGSGGSGGLGKGIGEALTPFGKWPTIIAAASPAIVDLTGAVAALSGSLAEAAAGAGALAIGGYGTASVGIAGIAAVAIPAVVSLKQLTKAQDAYSKAVATYGRNSTQAKTALKGLQGAEKQAGPAASALVKTLGGLKERWTDLTAAGRNNFLGLVNDALTRLQDKLPLLAKSANTSTAALRQGFDGFLKQITGPGYNHFIETMTGTFARIVPQIGHELADWVQIFMRISEAAAPSLERVLGLFTKWSDKLLASTGDSHALRQGVSHLTDQFLSWVHLLTATGNLLIAIFGAGAGQGQRLVDDLTGKLKEWTRWINSHQAATHAFFKRAADTTRELFTVLAGFMPEFMQLSSAMRPISQAFLAITKALNSIKIGNVSALTALLGAYVGLRTIGKVAGPLAAIRNFGGAGGIAGGAEAGAGAAAGSAGGGLAGLGLAAAPFAIAGVGAYELAQRKSLFDASAQTGSMVANALASHLASDLGPAIDKAIREKKLGKLNGLITQLKDQIGLAVNAGASAAEIAPLRAKLVGATKGALGLQLDKTAFLTNLEQLRTGAIQKLSDIKAAFRQNQGAIAGLAKDGSQRAKNYTIDNMNAEVAAIRAGIKAQTISRQEGLAAIRTILAQERQVLGTSDQQIIHSAKNLRFVYGQTLDSLNSATGVSLDQLQAQVLSSLKKFAYSTGSNLILGKFHAGGGPSVPPSGQFHATHGPIGKQTGGIVPGHGEGDSYPTAVPPGTFILNKKATAAFGFQSGGLTPVMLEPGERMFTPQEVKRHSLASLEAMNSAVPRFAVGGSVTEPHLRGPDGELKAIGQGALHLNYLAAQKFLQAHKPKSGGIGSGFSGPWVKVMQQIAKAKGWSVSDWRALIMGESGGNPAARNSSSGAYGLGQFLGSTAQDYAKYGALSPDGAKQIVAMAHYIADRYGNPTNAYHTWLARSPHWYAKGGLVGGIQHLASGGSAKHKPSAIEAMLARMKALQGVPYPHPDQHFGFSAHPSFLDCSAAVSDVLHAGGLLNTELTSTGLESWGKPGPGKLTVFANAGHAFLNMLGRFWGTSVDDGGAGGLGFHPAPSASYLAGFVKRHAPDGALGSGVTGSAFSNSIPAVLQGARPIHHYGVTPTPGGHDSISGTVNTRHYHVLTDKLNSFGSLPTTVEACNKELAQRRAQLGDYRAQLRRVKDPATRQALQTNINLLTRRIQALIHQRTRLLISRKATMPGFDKAFAQWQTRYDAKDAFAQQLAALEPTDITAAYIKQESDAYLAELGVEAGWRNTIIRAQNTATSRIVSLRDQITNIQALKDKHPDQYNQRKYKIPSLRKAIGTLLGLYNAKTNTGSYADALVNVQGYYPGRDIVSSLPTDPKAGSYGGLIFETQNTMRELGLRVASTAPDLSDLYKQLAIQANQRVLVQELHDAVFSGFAGPGGNYAGAFAKGGSIPPGMWGIAGEAGRPEVIQGPARVFSGADSQAMLANAGDPDVRVHIHGDVVSSHPDPVQVMLGDKRLDAKIEQVTRNSSRRAVGVGTPAGVLRR